MTTKFNLSIDLFTKDVQDAVDVAQALRGVADRLCKYTSLPWSPYALTGTIYASDGSKRAIGTWSVDSEAERGLTITVQNPAPAARKPPAKARKTSKAANP